MYLKHENPTKNYFKIRKHIKYINTNLNVRNKILFSIFKV